MAYLTAEARKILNDLRRSGQTPSGVIVERLGPMAVMIYEKRNRYAEK